MTREPAFGVTAAVSAEQVRFVAPGTVYQMRLEVFANKVKVFDSGLRFGNVLDWSFRDQEAQPLLEGTFACVVTVRDISGQLAKRWGALAVEAGTPKWLEPRDAAQATPQLQLLDPVTSSSDLIAASRSGAGLATTLLAHDGRGGLVASGSGGLSFRLGDYLAGQDVERMWLTELGNLGIGVRNPRAKLDVGGEIRTSEGIRFPDGTLQTTAASGSRPAATARGTLTPVFDAAVDGTGTPNLLAMWTSGTTVGNSTIADVGGNIGVGTAAPGGVFDLQRGSTGGILQRFWNTGTGGAKLRYVAGNGATSQLQLTDIDEWIAAIAANEAKGLEFRVRGTDPSDNTESGLAASTRMIITREGRVGIGTTDPAVGDLQVMSGVGDEGLIVVGGSHVNADSKVIAFGVGPQIGEYGAFNRLNLVANEFRFVNGDLYPGIDNTQDLGTSSNRWSKVWAANGTIQTSDARLKQAVTSLPYGLHEVLQLRPVTYEWKDRPDGRTHLGLIAQEVQKVLPEAVVEGSDPAATLGMNYADLVPVLIKAIQELEGRVAALTAENATLGAHVATLERASTVHRVANRR